MRLLHASLVVLALAVPSCATGGNANDAPLLTPDSGSVRDAAADGSGVDSSVADTGSTGDDAAEPAEDSGSSDDSPADDAPGSDGSPGADGGGVTDAVADTAPTDTGTTTCPGHGTSGALVTFDLASQSGSETSAAATTVATGLTSSALSRASALTATSGSGSINSSDWATTSTADPTRYYTFTVTPAAGCSVTLATLALDVRASATGPASGDVATSVDAFATHTTAFSGTSTPTVTLAAVSGTGAIELRVYGYGATSTAGTFRIENTMTLSGSIE